MQEKVKPQTFWIVKTPKELQALVDRVHYNQNVHNFILFDNSSEGQGKTTRAIQMACAMYKIDPDKIRLRQFKLEEATGKIVEEYIRRKRKKMPAFKPKIEHIDRFEIRLDHTTWHAKDEDEAKSLAKRIAKRKSEEWKESHTYEFEQIRLNKKLVHQFSNYLSLLKQRLHRELKKSSHYPESEEEEKVRVIKRELTKQILSELGDIMSGKREIKWSQGYFNDSSSYYLRTSKEEGQ